MYTHTVLPPPPPLFITRHTHHTACTQNRQISAIHTVTLTIGNHVIGERLRVNFAIPPQPFHLMLQLGKSRREPHTVKSRIPPPYIRTYRCVHGPHGYTALVWYSRTVARTDAHAHTYVHMCISTDTYTCRHQCICISKYEGMYKTCMLHMYVHTYVITYVRMCVRRMYVCTCTVTLRTYMELCEVSGCRWDITRTTNLLNLFVLFR